jgi:hypothetical protein
LTEHRDFDRRRDHPKFLLWEERGLAFDWAEGNSRKKEMNITLTGVERGREGGRGGGRGGGREGGGSRGESLQ